LRHRTPPQASPAAASEPRSFNQVDRVFDIELEFFLHDTAIWNRSDGPRLDPEEFGVRDHEKAMLFLTSQCGLADPLPGAAVEHHDEAFYRWREAIDAGVLQPPFEVVHVDAHADLGLGDAGYEYLFSELLRRPVEHQRAPVTGDRGLGAGNYLAFAIACRWIAILTFVVGGRPGSESLSSSPASSASY
jgi:UPF0489 domain